MKKLLIILILGIVGFVGYRAFLSEQGPPIVPYGRALGYGNEGIQEIRVNGMFVAEEHIVPGSPTVFYFCTENYPDCRRLHDKSYPALLLLRTDVAVRYIRLPEDWNSRAVSGEYQLNIKEIPHVIICDSDGRLIAKDDGESNSGEEFFKKWFKDEIIKKWKRKLAGK